MLFIVGFQPVKQYMDASFRADLQAGSGTVLSVASEKMVIQKHSQVNVCNLQQPIQLILDDLSTRILLGEGWYYSGGQVNVIKIALRIGQESRYRHSVHNAATAAMATTA